MMRTWVIAVAFVGAVFVTALAAQAPKTVWDGVYTSAQATRGAALYEVECAGCHGPSGIGGGMAPALVGAAFSANYDGLTVGDLFDRNRTTMPPGNEGAIGAQPLADITAFMLQFNDFPPGQTELPSQSTALRSIQYRAARPERTNQGNRSPGAATSLEICPGCR